MHNLTRFASRQNIERTLAGFQGSAEEKKQMKEYLEKIAREEDEERAEAKANANRGAVNPEDEGKRIGMMVSLDHTIFFHNPREFRADEWMLTEMETPWAGDGRGLVLQRIWSKQGVLIATCVQEGLVRLEQDGDRKSKL